jgi:hypothetical protein
MVIEWSWGSSVSIVTELRGWTTGVRFPAGVGTFFIFVTASGPVFGPTQPPIQWVQGVLSAEVKLPQSEADHSPLSSAEGKNSWSCTSIPPYVFMAWCLVNYAIVLMVWYLVKLRDNFTTSSYWSIIRPTFSSKNGKGVGLSSYEQKKKFRDLRFSLRWRFKSWSCGLWLRVLR